MQVGDLLMCEAHCASFVVDERRTVCQQSPPGGAHVADVRQWLQESLLFIIFAPKR